MKKIERRAVLCLVLAGLLLAGLALFLFRFFSDGGHWASSPFNRHLYNTPDSSSAAPCWTGTVKCSLPWTSRAAAPIPMGRPAASPSFTW